MRKPFEGDFRLTQGFGENPDMYARFGMKGHNGLDYGLPTGTQVLAPHSGKVIEAASDPTGYGNYLKIESDIEGSVLAHLKTFEVKVGDQVNEGQLVAYSNNTGNSTGPHLHWGYYQFPRNRQNGYAGFIDQLPLLAINATQAIIDSLRAERDNNWNLHVTDLEKIAELEKTIKDLEDKLQALREAFDKQTEADADLGAELIDAQHRMGTAEDIVKNIAKQVGTQLSDPISPIDGVKLQKAIDDLRSPHEEVAKQILPILEQFWQNLRKGKPRSFWDKFWELLK